MISLSHRESGEACCGAVILKELAHGRCGGEDGRRRTEGRAGRSGRADGLSESRLRGEREPIGAS